MDRSRDVRKEILLLAPSHSGLLDWLEAGTTAGYRHAILSARKLREVGRVGRNGSHTRSQLRLFFLFLFFESLDLELVIIGGLGAGEVWREVIVLLVVHAELGRVGTLQRKLGEHLSRDGVAKLQLPGEGELVLATGDIVVVLDNLAQVPLNVLDQGANGGKLVVATGATEALRGRVELMERSA